jgi:hypothetical protein
MPASDTSITSSKKPCMPRQNHKERKQCETCHKTYSRGRESAMEWALRRYCSTTCQRKASRFTLKRYA